MGVMGIVIFSILFLYQTARLYSLKILRYIKKNLRHIVKGILQLNRQVLDKPQDDNRIFKIYQMVHAYETHSMIKSINARADISVWYVPTAFWPSVCYI